MSEVCVFIYFVCSRIVCVCRHPLFQCSTAAPPSHPHFTYPSLSLSLILPMHPFLSLSSFLSPAQPSIRCGGRPFRLRLITAFHHNTWARKEITISHSVCVCEIVWERGRTARVCPQVLSCTELKLHWRCTMKSSLMALVTIKDDYCSRKVISHLCQIFFK